ncbi:multidrug resistance protein D [Legionella nautarum]|uniref:Bcr/CflA family efflux transporter n=1 Tax=Legionella nautarum TaxID=45070 RepID=A0A0W0X3H2_9GAMM|nr:multidrug effflux MFS transporter [Legionella nautarum]KTD39132.1 multidrug resistance protein D [Legionella nautarum]
MKIVSLPAIWLIILIAGIPQLSETAYTPSLPAIAAALKSTDSIAEYTLTIYLLGFAIGTLFWGIFSDRYGRKPCILAGFLFFIFGCVGCYFSNMMPMLMLNRFIQAFGGSVGSVLGQALCRDAFHGIELGRAYAYVGSSLGVYPAIGPVIGGIIAEQFGWKNIFLFLIIISLFLTFMVAYFLPETHPFEHRKRISIKKVVTKLICDKRAIGFGLLVAACNGLNFSFFAEGSFYLIKLLGLSPSQYGLSFIAIAISMLLGGIASRKLHNNHEAKTIMNYGINIILLGSSLFFITILLSTMLFINNIILIIVVIIAQMILMFGSCMVFTNALAMALVDYKNCIGTASSLFGFFYYSIISLFTFGMGALHNGTLFPMPLYFLFISLFMVVIRKTLLEDYTSSLKSSIPNLHRGRYFNLLRQRP